MIVAELPYDPTDPTVDSQIVSLKTLGADVFFIEATPKFAAQAIRKAAEIEWKPVTFVASISNSVGSVFRPANGFVGEAKLIVCKRHCAVLEISR